MTKDDEEEEEEETMTEVYRIIRGEREYKIRMRAGACIKKKNTTK